MANYVGQVYVSLSGMIIVPAYARYMGVEAYGLVAFFALLQTWFQLLDLGISHSLSREMARFRGGAVTALALHQLLRSMEFIFVAIALFGTAIVAVFAGTIARRWLKVEHLDLGLVILALRIIAASVGLRWVSTIYRSAVTGAEAQVWLNGFTVGIATARTFLIVPVFLIIGTDIVTFSIYQVVVSAAELIGYRLKARRLIPRVNESIGWSLKPVASILNFSLSVAIASVVWVLVAQTDKLVLSKILTLEAFGTFMFGVLAASAVNLAGGPVSQALLPRLARLAAEGEEAALLDMYRRATRWTCVLVASTTLTLVVFAEPLLLAWTGRADVARTARPILQLYASGNGLLAVAAFQYFLQYAHGNLRLHLIGSVTFLIVFSPVILWSASRYGAVGTGIVWLVQGALYASVWTYVVHRRFAPAIRWKWLFADVLRIWGVVALAALGLHCLHLDLGTSRWRILSIVAILGATLLLVGAAASPDAWRALVHFQHARRRQRAPALLRDRDHDDA